MHPRPPPPIPLHLAVSMEDLVTDLLSNPVDVSSWVPAWVTDAAAARRAGGAAGDASGGSLKAHVGIVSSATAILKDMEERGLLKVGRAGRGGGGRGGGTETVLGARGGPHAARMGLQPAGGQAW